jgi:hypothetical protein
LERDLTLDLVIDDDKHSELNVRRGSPRSLGINPETKKR